MLTVKAAADRLGLSAALVYGWVSAGVLDHYRVGLPGTRGAIRISEADLDAFLAGCRRGEKKPAAPAPPRPVKDRRRISAASPSTPARAFGSPGPVKLRHLHLS